MKNIKILIVILSLLASTNLNAQEVMKEMAKICAGGNQHTIAFTSNDKMTEISTQTSNIDFYIDLDLLTELCTSSTEIIIAKCSTNTGVLASFPSISTENKDGEMDMSFRLYYWCTRNSPTNIGIPKIRHLLYNSKEDTAFIYGPGPYTQDGIAAITVNVKTFKNSFTSSLLNTCIISTNHLETLMSAKNAIKANYLKEKLHFNEAYASALTRYLIRKCTKVGINVNPDFSNCDEITVEDFLWETNENGANMIFQLEPYVVN